MLMLYGFLLFALAYDLIGSIVPPQCREGHESRGEQSCSPAAFLDSERIRILKFVDQQNFGVDLESNSSDSERMLSQFFVTRPISATVLEMARADFFAIRTAHDPEPLASSGNRPGIQSGFGANLDSKICRQTCFRRGFEVQVLS